jgi:hypothetical protein
VARWGERTRPPAPAVDAAFEVAAVAEQATVTD